MRFCKRVGDGGDDGGRTVGARARGRGGGHAAGVLPRGGRRRAAGGPACCRGGVARTAATPHAPSPAPLARRGPLAEPGAGRRGGRGPAGRARAGGGLRGGGAWLCCLEEPAPLRGMTARCPEKRFHPSASGRVRAALPPHRAGRCVGSAMESACRDEFRARPHGPVSSCGLRPLPQCGCLHMRARPPRRRIPSLLVRRCRGLASPPPWRHGAPHGTWSVAR